VDEGVLFKLFLKYCYTGAQVGAPHEFGVGSICRQCGLSLGKPLDLIDFSTEGSGILAAQQGPLAVQVTAAAFEALSDAVRRRKTMVRTVPGTRMAWRAGLDAFAATIQQGPLTPVGTALTSVLDAMAGREGEAMAEVERGILWGPVAQLKDALEEAVATAIGPMIGDSLRARETKAAMTVFEQITEDPFIEGPRVLQEYWCAKPMAAGSRFVVDTVKGATWSGISEAHNRMIDALLERNADWFKAPVIDEMFPVLRSIGVALGPTIRAWMRYIHPSNSTTGPWTLVEAQMLLRCLVLQVWADAVTGDSPMYASVVTNTKVDATTTGMRMWTRHLMAYHVKQQYLRFSAEEIKRVLQERAEAERTSIVEEFDSIKDDDERAAVLFMKQFKIGRWGRGENIQKLDADQFEFETEQRRKMGIVDFGMEGGAALTGGGSAAQDFGFGALNTAAEDGYFGMDANGDD
jgi:hypothetical protein